MYIIELDNNEKIYGEILKMNRKIIKIKQIIYAPITLFNYKLVPGEKLKLDNEEFIIEDVEEGGVKLSRFLIIERKKITSIRKMEV